jgi:uncharacterized protein YbaR (Trm112 family)
VQYNLKLEYMGAYLQILALIIIGIVLLWFGYIIFFGSFSPMKFDKQGKQKKNPFKHTSKPPSGEPGDGQVCPVCSTRLDMGELVKSHAFPSITGGKDRLMYIQGCTFCLEENMRRRCPVCKGDLDYEDYLISRMFDRPMKRKHVHVLGCNHCKTKLKPAKQQG